MLYCYSMATIGKCVNRFQVLCFEQINRLSQVMSEAIPVHGKGNFPTLNIKLKALVKEVKQRLAENDVPVTDIRLNGGAASYILGLESPGQSYNDLDLIFGVDLSHHESLQKVKSSVLDSLVEFLPDDVNREKMNVGNLKEAYVHKMVKVSNDKDRWSLISLSNNKGRNVELKFVHKMKRQFEFSVDSFQILLDSLLTFYKISEKPMSEHFYPTVVAESMFGDFNEALHHLNKKLIATREPEQIRGGGLLKYCNLIVHGYKAAPDVDIKVVERYMCSRFFIDFPHVEQQRVKLWNYLTNHFIGEDHLKYDYLMTLHSVIDNSTVCLMGHERRQTLTLIQQFASHAYYEEETRVLNKHLAIDKFDSQNFSSTKHQGLIDQQSNLIIDQVFYHGVSPSQCPSVPYMPAMPVQAPRVQYYYSTPYMPGVYNAAACNTLCPNCPAPYYNNNNYCS